VASCGEITSNEIKITKVENRQKRKVLAGAACEKN
jgi:hypothetical protein